MPCLFVILNAMCCRDGATYGVPAASNTNLTVALQANSSQRSVVSSGTLSGMKARQLESTMVFALHRHVYISCWLLPHNGTHIRLFSYIFAQGHAVGCKSDEGWRYDCLGQYGVRGGVDIARCTVVQCVKFRWNTKLIASL